MRLLLCLEGISRYFDGAGGGSTDDQVVVDGFAFCLSSITSPSEKRLVFS